MKKVILNYLGGMVEFLDQIAYVGYLVAISLTLFIFLPVDKAIIYTIVLLLHILSIAICGFIKWNYDIGFKKPMYFVVSFIIFNIMLFLVSALVANILISLILFILLMTIGFLYILFTERMICETICKKQPLLERFFKIAPNVSCIILFALSVIFIIIPLFFLNMPIILKIIVPIIYIISMPLIAIAADNGMNIGEVIESDNFI